MPTYDEEDLQAAIAAYKRRDYASISRTSRVFGVPRSTLRERVFERKTRIQSHLKQQILSPIEEETLENWIYRAARLGAPITLEIVRFLAEEIQKSRFLNLDPTPTYPPISPRWVDRFRARHPRIKTCFSRPIDSQRSEALDYSTLKSYFDRLGDILRQNKYPPSAIFNVDETGFSIGSTRGSFSLYDRRAPARGKKQPGRQEWITSIE
jgi:hypothetical protein